MIFKIQPFSTTKELGKEYNAHCDIVPNDDWILVLDYDCMILIPETYQVIQKAIERYPDTKIFGAMTNRVGLSFQRHNLEMCKNDSIVYHMSIASVLAKQYADGEAFKSKSVAGFFMLFRKSYWLNNKFQEKIINEKGNLFDWEFCKNAGKSDGGIRIIKGAYLFHSYRLLKDDYRDKSHLK